MLVFKGLLLIFVNCEINVLGFSFHCLANKVNSGDSGPSAYEGICLALMWHLCSESVNSPDGWPGS